MVIAARDFLSLFFKCGRDALHISKTEAMYDYSFLFSLSRGLDNRKRTGIKVRQPFA